MKLGENTTIDLKKLIDSKLLIQANSGGGKSWLIRRILEQSHGQVQQIVLDPEGEFGSLREKYDYILAGKEGDTPAEPRSAALLARKLLELNVSAIIDLYELHPQERKHFVRLFLESMVNAPKNLWHPCLVVIDEAHTFVPEKGESEAANAVIGLASLGRKRGFGAILATQRIAKLHKDAAAECNNKLIGRTGLDIDRKRAAEEIGFTQKEQVLSLRTLKPGEFYAFGPAISDEVIKVTIGEVKTSHPKAGSHFFTKTTPPTEKIKKVLGKLADLPKEAEKEAKTILELQKEIFELRRHKCPVVNQSPVKIERIEVPAVGKRTLEGLKIAEANMRKMAKAIKDSAAIIEGSVAKLSNEFTKVIHQNQLTPIIKKFEMISPKVENYGPKSVILEDGDWNKPKVREITLSPIRGGAMRMLKVLVSRYPMKLTKAQLATFAKLKPTTGTFGTYFSTLKANNYIVLNGDLIQASQEGINFIGETPTPPQSSDEIIKMWRDNLKGGARRMFDALVRIYPNTILKEELAEQAGNLTATSGSFGTYLSILRSNGLIESNGNGIKVSENLFL